MAGADGVEHRGRVRTIGNQGVAGFASGRGARGGRGWGRAGLQRLHADRRPALAASDRRQGFHQMSKANLLDRRRVVASLLAERKETIVVGGLGASTYDISATGAHDPNLYLWCAMAGAGMIEL